MTTKMTPTKMRMRTKTEYSRKYPFVTPLGRNRGIRLVPSILASPRACAWQ